MVPTDDLPIAQTSRETVVINRAIDIMLNVFLAGPYDFERPIDLLGDTHRLFDGVDLKPATEAAAQQMIMKNDFVQRQPGELGSSCLAAGLHLDANPDLAGIGFHMH